MLDTILNNHEDVIGVGELVEGTVVVVVAPDRHLANRGQHLAILVLPEYKPRAPPQQNPVAPRRPLDSGCDFRKRALLIMS